MAHGTPVVKEIESLILKKLQETMNTNAELLNEMRHMRANYDEIKEKNEQLQSVVHSLRNDVTAKRPVSEVTQSEAVLKRFAREDIVTDCREAIETNRSHGSSDKAKINMMLKFALLQQDSAYIKRENTLKTEELEAARFNLERSKIRELQTYKITEERKSNEETLESYINSMWRT